MRFTKILILASLSLFLIIACEQNQKFGDVPSLSWRKANFRYLGDTADNRRVVDLTVYFTDGDGDIGREDENSSDTCDLANYSRFLERYDLFIYYYEQVNGEYREITPQDSCLPFHNILPNLTPTGQNKTLEGEITTPFDYANFPVNNTDSIRFEFLLVDRAGHESSRIIGKSISIKN
ncbi:hypothetical protein [Croceimicrobium hydrocarbonivorans]|uniref:Lipoprotein n=1 Tax=Croceimicrobium hydrocarbonivorans TaxID=2761580 RepID=A0A7H0VAF7_9FLAO|nr:hypothetical protein [Croceimicrobium hydrocarbonivorans]QNR22705.1 hypothetical protein H4K34_09955 [Croceimicrobium hydrocarbonivorans]